MCLSSKCKISITVDKNDCIIRETNAIHSLFHLSKWKSIVFLQSTEWFIEQDMNLRKPRIKYAMKNCELFGWESKRIHAFASDTGSHIQKYGWLMEHLG
jgi:hypothetical protein